MAQYVCKVWSADKKVRKTFMSEASLYNLVGAASKFGIIGNRIVLEEDGTEICDDAVLKLYLEEKATLTVLGDEDAENMSAEVTQYDNKQIGVPITDTLTAENLSAEVTQYDGNQDSAVILIKVPVENPSADTNEESDVTSKANTSDSFSSGSERNEPAYQLFENFTIPWRKVPSDTKKNFIT